MFLLLLFLVWTVASLLGRGGGLMMVSNGLETYDGLEWTREVGSRFGFLPAP